MKVEGNSPNQVDQAEQSKVERLQRAEDAKTARVAGREGDRVEVSPNARLAAEAIEAARSAPDIRLEAVERARVKLESGGLGADLERLADRLIDDLLSRS